MHLSGGAQRSSRSNMALQDMPMDKKEAAGFVAVEDQEVCVGVCGGVTDLNGRRGVH
jgi:hypothetical protein